MKEKYTFRKSAVDYLFIILTFFIVASTAFLIYAKMAAMPYASDLGAHIFEANLYLNREKSISYPGFHLMFGLFSRVFHLSDIYAAAVVLMLFALMTALAVYVVARKMLKNTSVLTSCLIVLFITFFGPLYFGGDKYYAGQGSFNTWHNPTNACVKFFTICCFYLFNYTFYMNKHETVAVAGINLKRSHMQIALCIFTALSVVFKPSFFQVFAPMLAIVFLIDIWERKRNVIDWLKDAAVFIPAVGIILYQMVSIFFSPSNGSEGGVTIAFGAAWSCFSSNVPRSILTHAAFPIFVCLFCEKNIFKNKNLFHGILFYVIGIFEALLLAEKGERFYHGNFMWGKDLGIGIIYLSSVLTFLRFVQKTDKRNKREMVVTVIGFVFLSVQFVLGIWYYYKLLVTPELQLF